MVFIGGASSFQQLSGKTIYMENENSDSLKSKLTYLRFIYKMTEHINSGKKPSAEMIKQTRKLGRRVNIPEEELKNLGIVSFYG